VGFLRTSTTGEQEFETSLSKEKTFLAMG